MANDLSAFNSEAWSERLVIKLDQKNVMLRLVNRNWEGDLRNNKTVWIRTPGNVTTAPYTRGTQISYQDLVPTKEAFTVNNGTYFAFEVDDIDRAQSDVNAMDVYMLRGVVAMNNAVETLLINKAAASVPTANKITGASSAAITLDSSTSTSTGIYQIFVKARTLLSKNDVPLENRWAVIDPDTTALLLQDTAHFVRASDLGDNVVRYGLMGGAEVQMMAREMPGFIGQIAGFDVFETPHVATDLSVANFTTPGQTAVTTVGAKYLLFGDAEALSYAGQITEIEALRLQTTFANAVRGLLLHDGFVAAEAAKRLVSVKATP